MGLGLSKNHGDRNPENNVQLACTEESQNQEPEQSPVTEQMQNQEAGSNLGTEQPQIQVPQQSPETGGLYFEQCVTLHKAALQGNWKNAKKSIRERPNLANISITEGGETALHLAAAGRSVYFVARLLEEMAESSLRKPNSKGQTAFCYAAIGDHVKIAKKMMKKDQFLIRQEGFRPLYYAAWQGNKDMANYLFKESIQQSNGPVSQAPGGDQIAVGEDQNSVRKVFHSWLKQDQVAVLLKCIHSGLYDLAVKIVKEKKELAIAEDNGETPLLTLARKPLAFRRTRGRGFWHKISNTTLQMQREVLWYKEVEKVVPANYITMKNDDDKTPHEMFSKEHENLMKEGEKQIKQIAKACMLVTTLITTIVFTTAFTVPGGYNNKGAPILQHEEFFMVLPISQAIGTLSSLFSMLMFLSVLSSRFSKNDFLTSLPLWLVLGVTSLFLSIVAMMVAFCRCLFFYEPGFVVKVALLVPFAIVPIIFLILKFHLFFTIFRCTYSSTWLFRSNNRLFS